MIKVSYDLHIHSCLSPCGDDDMTPCNIAGMAHINGLGLIALTDHNSCGNCLAFEKACAQYGIATLCGMELTTAEEIHLICLFETAQQALGFEEQVAPHRMQVANRKQIFGEQRLLNEHDEPIGEHPYLLTVATSLSIDEAVALARKSGGAVYPAHIDRESNGILAILGDIPKNLGFSCVECADAATSYQGMKKIVCSDAHRLWDLKDEGNTIELESEGNVARAMLRYLGGLQA